MSNTAERFHIAAFDGSGSVIGNRIVRGGEVVAVPEGYEVPGESTGRAVDFFDASDCAAWAAALGVETGQLEYWPASAVSCFIVDHAGGLWDETPSIPGAPYLQWGYAPDEDIVEGECDGYEVAGRFEEWRFRVTRTSGREGGLQGWELQGFPPEQGTWDHDREGRVAGWKNGDGEGLVCADCARETDGDPVTMAEAGEACCCVRCGRRIA